MYPSPEYRLLAAFRIYTIMEYFHAYRALYGEDWDQVLRTSIPRFEAARDSLEYALAVASMVNHIHDSHGFIASPVLSAWRGRAPTAVRIGYIEHQPVIVGFLNDTAARAAGAGSATSSSRWTASRRQSALPNWPRRVRARRPSQRK